MCSVYTTACVWGGLTVLGKGFTYTAIATHM